MKDISVKKYLMLQMIMQTKRCRSTDGCTNRSSNRFGFIELNDGSCFKSIQVVYEKEGIENFDEVSKITIASGITVKGILVLTPSQAALRDQGRTGFGGGRLRDGLPCRKTSQSGIPERNCTSSPQEQYFFSRLSCEILGCLCDSQVLPGTGVHLCAFSYYHRQRCGRSRPDVPCHYP